MVEPSHSVKRGPRKKSTIQHALDSLLELERPFDSEDVPIANIGYRIDLQHCLGFHERPAEHTSRSPVFVRIRSRDCSAPMNTRN